jgi:hypothetical protein
MLNQICSQKISSFGHSIISVYLHNGANKQDASIVLNFVAHQPIKKSKFSVLLNFPQIHITSQELILIFNLQ